MEFCDLGGICSFCKRQDFLPIKCNLCNKIFCKDHSSLEKHNCINNSHINNKKKPFTSIYKESCNYPGCKKKEIIKFECKDCNLNYCINHRLSFNHNCNIKKNIYSSNNNLKKDDKLKIDFKKKDKKCNCIIM